jgi:hypothetical protein
MARAAEFTLIRLQIVMPMGLGVPTHASHQASCDVKVAGQRKSARGKAASRLADVRVDFHSRLDAAAK